MTAYTGSPALPPFLAGDVPSTATDWAAIVAALHGATDAWTTWAPTLTNLTLGNGAVAASYRQLGKVVDFRFKFTLGTTSAVGTGPSFTLPVQPSAAYVAFIDPVGEGQLRTSAGATSRLATIFVSTLSVSTVQIIGYTTTGTQLTVTATAPHTWASTDVLTCSGRYEAV